MAIPKTLDADQLDKAMPQLLKLALQTGDRAYLDSIDRFDPVPSADNDWLQQEDGSFAGVFVDDLGNGVEKRVRFVCRKTADGWETETELEAGQDFAEFAETIGVGTTVSWSYAGGKGEGKVIKKYTKATTLKLQGSEITRNGTEDNPALLIEQEGGQRVLKLRSEVSVSKDYAEPIELSGSTELLDDAEWDALAESVSDAGVIEDVMDAIGELDDQP